MTTTITLNNVYSVVALEEVIERACGRLPGEMKDKTLMGYGLNTGI